MAEARAVRPPEQDRPKWVPWLIALVVLLIIGAVVWALAGGDDDDEPLAADAGVEEPLEDDELLEEEPIEDEELLDEEPTDTATEDTMTEDTATEDTATEDATDGMASDGPLVLAVPFPDLAAEEGREVSVDRIEVVDVPADEAFTIGTDDDELLVYITEEARAAGGPESATNVEPGSVLTSLEGTVEPITDELLSQMDLTGDEADAVQERGFYIAATAFEIASS